MAVNVDAEIEAALERSVEQTEGSDAAALKSEIRTQLAGLPDTVKDAVVARFGLRARREAALALALEAFHKLGLSLGDMEATIPDIVRVAKERGDHEALSLVERAFAFLDEVHRLDRQMARERGRDGHLS